MVGANNFTNILHIFKEHNGTEVEAENVDNLDIAYSTVLGLVLGLIILITIVGNLLVVLSVGYYKRLRSKTNMFVVSLAVADLLVAILVMPYAIVYELYAKWKFGWIFCYFWISCDVTCCTASILHLCVISLDRYLAITQPLRYRKLMSKGRVLILISGVWVCSTAISFVPIYLGWYADEKTKENLYIDIPDCGLFVNRIYAVISSLCSFYIPLTVMLFAYLRIFKIARKQAKEIQKLENSFPRPIDTSDHQCQQKKHKRTEKDRKAIKTLGTLMGVFCFCWVPFFLMYVIMPFCEHCQLPPLATSLITWLGYLNSAINPCVYAFMNRDFRKAFVKILACAKVVKCCREQQRTRSFRLIANTRERIVNPDCQEYIMEERVPSSDMLT